MFYFLCLFFDDTQIEISPRHLNFNGHAMSGYNKMLCMQTA